MSRKERKIAWIGAVAALALAGCSNDEDGFTPPAQAQLRVVHASPDAPPVDVLVGGTTVFENLDFRQGTAFAALDAGTARISVRARTPGAPTTVIGPADVPLAANRQYTVIATGTVASLAPLVLERPTAAVAAGAVRVQVVHAAPAAPRVSVYVTAPGADLAASAPLGTFAFRETLGPAEVPAGQYQIRVTPAGASTPVLYDSGPVTLSAGADLLISAVANTGPGTAPIELAATAADGSDLRLLDRATPANIRVIHGSPDTPPVSVFVNENFAQPFVPSLAYPQFTPYVSVPAGTYDVKVTPEGNPGVIAIDADLTLAAGTEYSVYALGRLAQIAPLVTTDDRRRLATQAKVRIVHGAPGAGTVDIYVTAPGAGIANAAPAFTNVPFRADTGFVSLAQGAYDVTVTPAGTKTAAIGPARLTLDNTGVYTVIARDAPGGGAPFGVILIDEYAGN